MNLPPLPDDIEQEIYARTRRFVEIDVEEAVRELLREYGEACAKQALEEAAQVCMKHVTMQHLEFQDYMTAQECQQAIMSLIK